MGNCFTAGTNALSHSLQPDQGVRASANYAADATWCAAAKTLDAFLADAGVGRDDVARTVATGSQVVDELLPFLHFDATVSEVSAHIAAATRYYPDCQAILDVGGQDSKAMLFDEEMKIWVSKMSGICAAGTGAFLDSVAARLNVPVEQLAEHVNYDSPLQLSSVCAVFGATSVNKFKIAIPLRT